jgi:hypothetical protein
MPTEAIDRLTAHAAKSRPQRACMFSVWRRRRPERARQSFSTVAEPPSPATGHSAASRKGPREAIRAEWMGAPIRFDCEPRRRRHEGTAERPRQNARWKMVGNALLRRASDCRFLSAFSSCQSDIGPPPCLLASCNRKSKAFVVDSNLDCRDLTPHPNIGWDGRRQ